MDQDTRNSLQRATQKIRQILEDEFSEQLEGTFDILADGTILPEPGKHLDATQRLTRRKLVDAIEHIKASGKNANEAVDEYKRESAFTFLNRFVALRMLESRALVQECVSKGDESSGFKEFCGLALGLAALRDDGYQLYLECLCDELSVEVKGLFDRRDSASLLWPRRGALTELLDILGQADLATVWSEDETIGWVYQYFNSDDERKKMREESPAPRNSRELAVRNQFFTPRYVVEFLTDNTLGRIWYEMRQGQTRLVDECCYLIRHPNEVFLNQGQEVSVGDSDAKQDPSQEELLNRTVYVPHRSKKDPRDLKIVDPACGSGHFLLYAFDLLLTIYEEAWHDEASPLSEVTGRRLRDEYPELKQLDASLPSLVLAHNLHGIDIDPRAAQIAALALWMRGQRAFNEFRVPREQRMALTRSNIVCAEPMPGETAFLSEFIDEYLSDSAEGRFLASLVEKVFESMKLAGEAGSLLKIDEDIAEEVAKAKKQWLERPELRQPSLFDNVLTSVQQELDLTDDITDESFWEDAEQRIYDALRAYAEHAEQRGGFQRRLFAVDAARGFSFIGVSRNRYDVAVMNPPFGDSTATTSSHLKTTFKQANRDIYSAFVIRASQFLNDAGALGAITSRAGFYLSSMQNWRKSQFLDDGSLTALADLGYGVLDAKVETAAYCVFRRSQHVPESELSARPIVFVRLLAESAKETSLRNAIDAIRQEMPLPTVFISRLDTFKALPTTPFAYATPPAVIRAFAENPKFEANGRCVRAGVQTSDDFRFLRCWWEVSASELFDYSSLPPWRDSTELFQEACRTQSHAQRWCPFAKGGEYSPLFADVPLVINWHKDGEEIKAYAETTPGTKHWSRNIRSTEFYFRPGLTYLARTSIRLCATPLPAGAIISNEAGPGIFVDVSELYRALARFNSLALELMTAVTQVRGMEGDDQTKKYVVGALQNLPWPQYTPSERDESIKGSLAQVQRLRGTDETSRSYLGYRTIDDEECAEAAATLLDIDRAVTEAFKLDPCLVAKEAIGETNKPAILSEIKRTLAIASAYNDEKSSARAHFGYLFGIVAGRWNWQGSERATAVPEPFAPLPPTAPAQAGSREREFGAVAGLSVDDPGHELDVRSLIRTAIEMTGDQDLDAVEQRLCEALGKKDIRDYVRKDFFSDHCKQYSRSRRKAPIYWQLATRSASYSVWLYYHRFTKDTFFKVLNEYVKPKLDHERQKLDRLRGEAGAEPTRSQRKEIEDQEKFVAELASMVEEVERIAPLWNPNLNDGVIINFAPLWRLVPQNKSWQMECKKVWDKLVAGDYDWSHLAMHLWPERVVPKFVTDASLAIAHGLEETFWKQDDRDRFQPLEEPQGGWDPIIKQLVAERSSPAVKAALESLLNAPAQTTAKTKRKRKAAAK